VHVLLGLIHSLSVVTGETHVLALLVELEPAQAKLLEEICGGPTLDIRR
jgi:hypothetical protein